MLSQDCRVLKAHVAAALAVLQDIPEGVSLEELARLVAAAVLTANDGKIRYVVVTDDYLAFGPYATRGTAAKAALSGQMAHRADGSTRGMVLPLRASPRELRAEAENSSGSQARQ